MPDGRRRVSLACLGALLVLVLAPSWASAEQRTQTLRVGPVTLAGFQTKYPARAVRSPQVSGFVVRMHARLVDARGRPIPIDRVMLHHVVFINRGPRGGMRRRSACPGRTGEPFYGTGEEHQRLILPPGYGYRIGARDRWRAVAMYMSHVRTAQKVYLEYTVTISDSKRLEPVKPLWLRANGCDPQSSYTVPGGGAPGSADVRSYDWRMPISGRIVAAGAHLHGGAKSLNITEPRCGDRMLVHHRPLWGAPDDRVYRVRPLLHEPGPIATGYFLSRTGIPVRRGQILRVTGRYDGEIPHPMVMAISHIYVAKDDRVPPWGCPPLPADGHVHWTRTGGRRSVAPAQVPLTGLDAFGDPVEIPHAAGPLAFGGAETNVDLEDSLFKPSNLLIPRGGRVTWSFRDSEAHVVVSANAPRAVDSPIAKSPTQYSQSFTVPGTYNLFCYLHPTTMHQTLTVR
jgi:plastocyanin